ncbi:DoxX family protein [Actinoplanes sp. NPDC020271]|uniref:DoxX family protein n=1 Tax=Actinoplanes sp. NPDC020271 TaxID=3363896 RepID=UPI003795C271
MHAAHITLTIVAAFLAASASVTYLIGHDYPKAQLRMKRLPLSWMPRLGAVLAAGAAGLLAGFAVPLVGVLAAAGLFLYFAAALVAHLRVGSRDLIGWAVFFTTMTADLIITVLHTW